MSGTASSSSPASDSNAKQSRRSEVSTCAASRARRRSWLRPFRSTRRSVDHSLRLIEKSCRVIEAAERFASRRPLRASKEYERASGCLDKATVQLSFAARALSVMTGRIALSPEQALDSPRLLIGVTERWIAAAGELAVISTRLDDTFGLILDAIATGTTLDFSEFLRNPIVPARRVIRLRPLPPRSLSCNTASICIVHRRRRQSARLTVAEAARRIFRGRAPPRVSTCPL
jgi:hypothetical protein